MSGATQLARLRTRSGERRSTRDSRHRWAIAATVLAGVAAVLALDGLVGAALVVFVLSLFASFAIAFAGRPSTGRRVAIVGDADFAAWAHSMARARGRDVEVVIRPDIGGADPLPPVDEVIVEHRFYDVIDEVAPESRVRGRLLFAHPNAASGEASVKTSNPFDPVLSPGARTFKRALDLVLLVLLSPFVLVTVPFIAIAVKLSSRGPVFFSQERVGADGQLFRLYKFRTMYVDNDDSLHRDYVAALMRGEAAQHNGMYKLADDPRVTRVGRFLRRYSLDEIPQLWNVLLGDMSIVGPRPPLLTESQSYDAFAWNRLRVLPGLTGLWQVSGRCALSFREMVELDIEYWRKWSPLLDVRILARTPVALASTRGAA